MVNSLLSCCVLLLVLLSLALPTTSLRTRLLSRHQLSQQFTPLSSAPLSNPLPPQLAIDTPTTTLPGPLTTVDQPLPSTTVTSPTQQLTPAGPTRPVHRLWQDVLVNSRGDRFAAHVEAACTGPTCSAPLKPTTQPQLP